MRQAIRAGELYWSDVLPAYLTLKPSTHRFLTDERVVDIAALGEALRELPSDFFDATRLLAVPSIEGFEYEPAGTCAGSRLGRLGDGTLLIEIALASAALMEVSAVVCCVLAASQKARRLLPEELIERLRLNEAQEPNDLGEIEQPANIENQVDADHEYSQESTHDALTSEDILYEEDPHHAEDDIVDPAALIAHVAFAWGTDPITLQAGNAASNGMLLNVLLAELDPPILEIHPGCSLATRVVQHESGAEAIVQKLAETGLIGRPLHLWVGPSTVINTLSPYSRDLRDALTRWAHLQPQALTLELQDRDLTLANALNEDALYHIAADFVRSAPSLYEERTRTESSVGIRRLNIGGLNMALVDLGRVDSTAVDARLGEWRAEDGALFMHLPLDLSSEDGGILPYLLKSVGKTLRSLTIVLPGMSMNAGPGCLGRPTCIIDGGSLHQIIPDSQHDDALMENVLAYANAPLQTGAILSVASSRLTHMDNLNALRQSYNVSGIIAGVGGWGAVQALQNLKLQGVLPVDYDLWFIGQHLNERGEPCLSTTSGLSALGIAKLRQLNTQAPVPDPAPLKTPAEARPAQRTVRIRV